MLSFLCRWLRPRRYSVRIRYDPTPHPVDLWLDDPDEHDGHLVAVIGEGQRPDPGPPPASVFPRSSDGQGGGPMPPPGHLHTSRLGDEDDWCDGARRAGDAFAAEVLKARAEVDRAAWGLPARGRVFPVCLSTAPLPGAGPIAEAAGPVEIVLPPESCDADGWPKYTIFRAPDGTTRPPAPRRRRGVRSRRGADPVTDRVLMAVLAGAEMTEEQREVYDYVAARVRELFPPGARAEEMRGIVLADAERQIRALLPPDRFGEHVTVERDPADPSRLIVTFPDPRPLGVSLTIPLTRPLDAGEETPPAPDPPIGGTARFLAAMTEAPRVEDIRPVDVDAAGRVSLGGVEIGRAVPTAPGEDTP